MKNSLLIKPILFTLILSLFTLTGCSEKKAIKASAEEKNSVIKSTNSDSNNQGAQANSSNSAFENKVTSVNVPSAAFSSNSNTVNFTNKSSETVTYIFTENAGQPGMPALTINSGETKAVTFPNGWSGNLKDKNDTVFTFQLGELAFNQFGNKIYFDVSSILGLGKHSMYMISSDGVKSGLPRNMLSGAPGNTLNSMGVLIPPKQVIDGAEDKVRKVPDVDQFGPQYPEWNTLNPSAQYLYSIQKKGDFYVGVGFTNDDKYDDAATKATGGSLNVEIY